MSDESIKPPSTSTNILNALLNYDGTKIRVEFKGSCLKQDHVSFNDGKIVNIYIVNKINKSVDIISYPTLENCLFGAVKLVKHLDIDQYKYSGFDRKAFFSFVNTTGRKLIVFGVDMSSPLYIDNE